MKCDEIKTLLNPYLDNEAAQADAERIKKHLKECPACAKEMAELKKVREMLHKLPVLTAPSKLLERVQCDLARPNAGIPQRNDAFLRYRWLTFSLASAAAVILVAFTLMIQFRKINTQPSMPAGRPDYNSSEKSKADFTASVAPNTETMDVIQAQPMLFTQQINISTRNVDDTIAKVYALASTQTPDLNLRAEYREKQAAQEELLAKAPDEQPIQNENPTVANSVAPLREKKIQQQRQSNQVVKISIPLSQKDAFIKQLKGDINITGKLVLSEMQSISRDKLTAGYLADAEKPIIMDETQAKGDEPADQGARSYDTDGKDSEKISGGKQAEANKMAGGKSYAAKNDKESPKDKPAEQLKPSPVAAAPMPPSPPPPPPGAPAPSAPARGATPPPPSSPSIGLGKAPAEKKKESNQDKDMKKLNDTGVISQTFRVQPEPMIEFIIVIEPNEK